MVARQETFDASAFATFHHPDAISLPETPHVEYSHVPFVSQIIGNNSTFNLHGSVDPALGQVTILNGVPENNWLLPLGDLNTLHVLAGTVQSSLVPINIRGTNPTADPRCPQRKMLERAISTAAPFDLQAATKDTISPPGENNPSLTAHLKTRLFMEIDRQAKKLHGAKMKKAELAETNPKAASQITTTETELEKLPHEVALTLRALAMGDEARLMQLVAETKTLEIIRAERETILRGVGEYVLFTQLGIPKSFVVAQQMATLPKDISGMLTDKERRHARSQFSPQFADEAEKLATATLLTNKRLEEIGLEHFTADILTEAQSRHDNALEPQQAEKEGLVQQDYSTLSFEDGRLVNLSLPTKEGLPFKAWQELPIVPLLMKNKGFREIDPAKEDPVKTRAHNIMLVLESGQVSNHGAHVAISAEARQRMTDAMEDKIRKGEPIKLDLYYTLARMANPLEGLSQTPGLQEWAMLYKFAQITKTAELFYQPDEGPSLQWVLIDEGPAFADIWDLEPVQIAQFRDGMVEMIKTMGLDDTILYDSLKRMADEGGSQVQDLIRANYNRIRTNWESFTDSGLSLDEYLNRQNNIIISYASDPPIVEQAKLAISDIQTIADRHISMMRLVNPQQNFPDLKLDDLLMAYSGIMPHVQLEGPLTMPQQRVLQEIEKRGLHANAYSKAVMDARGAMRRGHPDAISVTITDKQDKLVVFPGDDRTQVFPGHGEAAIMYSHRSSFGTPEPGKDWVNVCRGIGIVTQQTRGQGGIMQPRFVGIIDPTDSSQVPYYYIEQPAFLPSTN